MKTIQSMLRSHPRAAQQQAHDYAVVIETLSTCQQICTSCADACLGESIHLAALRRCIRTDLDCADVCATMIRLLVRQTETPNSLVHAQLHACALACQLCADECGLHATMHEHCRICAEVCRQCQEKCNLLLGEISSSGIEAAESSEMSL